jgi:L-ascorbate metabolism protein UlaG (beta-lactamase superfamily)
MNIELTWANHACVRVTRNGFTLVIDAGILSATNATEGADALLYTHAHLDHFDIAKLATAAAARPGLRIYTNKALAAQIQQSGAAAGARVHAVGDGDRFDIGGIPVSVHGEWHALIHKDIPRVRNVG